MISQEPVIRVGIIEQAPEVRGSLQNKFAVANVIGLTGEFSVRSERGTIIFTNADGQRILSEDEILCQPFEQGTFVLNGVTIGKGFHWERTEDESFGGRLRLIAQHDRTVTAVNELNLESYLKCVIASEMSAEAPVELLRAHAIISRSWLAALLERRSKNKSPVRTSQQRVERSDEILRWYGHEDHKAFDVCADDHCQRYQGLSKIISNSVSEAVESTRGTFLVSDEEICDARYSKACGGLTEDFESVWDDVQVPYLRSVSDSATKHKAIRTERDAERWMSTTPEAYCNTSDESILKQILPSFDQETKNFFRWTVKYSRKELEELIKAKSGIDFGVLKELVPVARGASGRIVKLKIVGTEKTLTVGKELEIRKWLSRSHLYSSAFTVRTERNSDGDVEKFIFTGAGWGHGVGLCQIGAAVMASKGFKAEEILAQYFRNAELSKRY